MLEDLTLDNEQDQKVCCVVSVFFAHVLYPCFVFSGLLKWCKWGALSEGMGRS